MASERALLRAAVHRATADMGSGAGSGIGAGSGAGFAVSRLAVWGGRENSGADGGGAISGAGSGAGIGGAEEAA
jgi:hypothetical protein